MGSLSRRNFIQAGGAAAAGAVALRSGTAEAAAAADVVSSGVDHHTTTAHQPTAAEPVVVFVRDAAKGEVSVLVDGDEIVVRDKVLVGRVQKITRQGRR
ncbi:MAG: twin-arginine translocation signal domain-containing protein [Ilumatobacteraceae bacterium]